MLQNKLKHNYPLETRMLYTHDLHLKKEWKMWNPREGRQSKLPSFQELIVDSVNLFWPRLIYRPSKCEDV